MTELEQSRIEWYNENAPLGMELGYPKCCIDQFCDDSPLALRSRPTTATDKLRYDAGCINGKFTGFIPCGLHAWKILSGQTTLHELIKNRSPHLPPFPDAFPRPD